MTRVAINWRTIALVLVGVPSIIVSAVLISLLFLDGESFDWWTFEIAASRSPATIYEWGLPSPYAGEPYSYRYGPLFAYLMTPITALGLWVWRLLHLAALLLLPRRLALITLVFAPFWYDVLNANVMTFVFVAAWFAIQGNRWGTLAFFALLVMVPRPLMLPIAAWIVWQRPEWRLPAAGFAVIGLLTLAWPGFLPALVNSGELAAISDKLWEPGLWWFAIGLPLAGWLTWKGRVGLASLAVSPYILPHYFLMLLLELRNNR